MSVELYEHQIEAVERMRNGCILYGKVGSGKSRTSLAYYFAKACKGELSINGKGKDGKMERPYDLYIITTAKKRDSHEWEEEMKPFGLSTNIDEAKYKVKVVIDSWNNIKKYVSVTDAFFLFDEDKVCGSGAWVKAFLKITKNNRWIIATASPGDVWKDYIPVFIANGYFKNKTEFLRKHVVFNRFTKYPSIDHYVNTGALIRYRREILVRINYERPAEVMEIKTVVPYNKILYMTIFRDRWNPYDQCPIENVSQLCYLLRRAVNSDSRRLEAAKDIICHHDKTVVFYNYDYELEDLKTLCELIDIPYAQWNGHKHEEIPKTDTWVYLVNYMAGSEGWNCIETNVMLFYSENYSYKMMLQAAGRIDRVNTPFDTLYYYRLRSTAPIDIGIAAALKKKKNFNESAFINS